MEESTKSYQKLRLYHFTDTRNLPLIRKLGGILSLAELQRLGEKIEAPGGNDWSWEADKRVGMDHYVHLCLSDNHPMEWNAKKEARIVQSIFLEVSKEILSSNGVLFCPVVSNKAGAEFFDMKQGYDMIDFEVLYERTDWSDSKIKERKNAARKCEILIPDMVASKFIRNLPHG